MNSQRYTSRVGVARFPRVRSVLAAGIGMLLALSLNGKLHAADTIKGGRLYATNCALCHGASGISVMPGAPNFARGDGMLRPDMTLLAAIRTGKNAMPAFQGMLADRDIMDVIAYLRTLH
jgi:cytochrome c6